MSSAGWTRWQRRYLRMTEADIRVTPEGFVTSAPSKKSSVDEQESDVEEPEAKRPIRRRVVENPAAGDNFLFFLLYSF
jgi:hypothetical protein